MGTLLGTELTALLARAGVRQAAFARLTGTTRPPGRAMARLALAYNPDKGGTQAQMARMNAAQEQAKLILKDHAAPGAE